MSRVDDPRLYAAARDLAAIDGLRGAALDVEALRLYGVMRSAQRAAAARPAPRPAPRTVAPRATEAGAVYRRLRARGLPITAESIRAELDAMREETPR